MTKVDNTARETETEFYIRNMRHQISALEHQLKSVEYLAAGSEVGQETLDQLWLSSIKISEAISGLAKKFRFPGEFPVSK